MMKGLNQLLNTKSLTGIFLTKDLSGLSVIKLLNILLVKKNTQGLKCGGKHVYNCNV